MMRGGICGVLFTGAAALVLAASPPARPADVVAADSESSGLEQIVVTARRREENLQSVPIAVTVLSEQTLQQNNVKTLGDLQSLVPSLSTTTQLSRDAINVGIRGQGANGISGLPGVIAYLSEVPIPTDKDGNLVGGPGLLFDLANVQVLKGPQGTLFGRNSVGGALLLEAARPTNEFGGAIQAGYGNYNDREIDGQINMPIIDGKLLTRIAINGQVRDGFTKILAEPGHPDGVDADNRDYWSARGTVEFKPSDSFQNDTVLTFSSYTSHGAPFVQTDLNPAGTVAHIPGFAAFFAQQQALGIRTVLPLDTHLVSSGSNFMLSDTARVSLGEGLTFRNIFGFDEAKTAYAFDLDGTVLPLLDLPNPPRKQTVRQFSDEAQLLGKSFGDRLDWIAGAFFLDQPQPRDFVLQASTQFFTESDTEYRQGDKSKALFAQGTYDLSAFVAGLKFTGGARYTWDERFLSQRGGTFGAVCTGQRVACDTTLSPQTKDSALTWTVGLDYQATPDTLLYLTSRRGYRAGGANLQVVNGNILGFGPEFVKDVELGVKSDWKVAGVPIRTNADVYYEKYTDIQVLEELFLDGAPVLSALTANAAAARIAGAELETVAKLTPDLELGASFDYLSFRYTDFGPTVDSAQLEATRTANRPPRKYGLNARYRLPIAAELGSLSLRAVWSWQSSSGDTSQPGGIINEYGLLNLAADWNGLGGSPLDVSLFASNVTDRVYRVGVQALYDSLGYSVQRFGEPRMYGVRLRYRFGSEAR